MPKHPAFELNESDAKAYYRDKFVKNALIHAKKCARRYARHVLITCESQMIRPSHAIQHFPLTLQGTTHTMATYGVRDGLREYAAKMALQLIKQKGGN